jgi:hypothetical protein
MMGTFPPNKRRLLLTFCNTERNQCAMGLEEPVSTHLTGTLAEPLSRGFPILALGSHGIQLFESHKKSEWGKFVLFHQRTLLGLGCW